MKRRTSALSLSAAAAVLLTAPMLTGCSTDSHPGAAAVVGDEVISIAEVQDYVQEVRDGQLAQPDAEQSLAESSSLTRSIVHQQVFNALVKAAAEDAGIEVTTREVQDQRALTEEQLGGPEALDEAAIAEFIAPSKVDDTFRSALYQDKLWRHYGNDDARITAALKEAATEVGVTLNPRYGDWDEEQFAITEPDTPWLNTLAEEPGVPEALPE
ncbi:SurA N-terminal domain-containing protein [Streptomyces aidingensis]|uniref:SurA N-terminal domain-containing protein n=1 Tax=Streptomyces aidingensis TaxID=910347 RepID=A0A1I1H0H5_9ACTN|nr:SurA N-terminal domain-containing protein [Streptomyces aidingensis]SFC14690.1 SurA N-terminal domain-containing protein [Streptomyces aidingensis]